MMTDYFNVMFYFLLFIFIVLPLCGMLLSLMMNIVLYPTAVISVSSGTLGQPTLEHFGEQQ